MTAIAVFSISWALTGQVPPPGAPPVPVAPAQQVAPAEPSRPVVDRAAARRRRDEIGVMEGVLAAAVRLGASQIARELQASSPGPAILAGQPRARGFILDGYGVFFNVEIPTFQKSVVWSIQQLQRDQIVAGQALEVLRSAIDSLPDANAKREYQAAVKRIERQVGPLPPPGDPALAAAAANVAAEPEDEPDTRYTRAVINACLDAMVEHSKPMELAPDEWLTVALSGADATLPTNELYESSMFVLRIKGSDLADYLAGRLTREQVRAKVEVREF